MNLDTHKVSKMDVLLVLENWRVKTILGTLWPYIVSLSLSVLSFIEFILKNVKYAWFLIWKHVRYFAWTKELWEKSELVEQLN